MHQIAASEAGTWRFRLMGAFTASSGGRTLSGRELGSRQGRTLLKLLLVERRHVVSADRIAEVLWGERPPDRWQRDVAVLVSRLRRVLGAESITGGPDGYRFVPSDRLQVDLDEAEKLVEEADARLVSAEAALAAAASEQALEVLGAGSALEDEPFADWADQVRRQSTMILRRARRCAWQARLELSDFSGSAEVAGAAIAADPMDEDACRALMVAFRRAGRPAEALAAFEQLRAVLADELGTDPASDTTALHLAILRDEEEIHQGPEPRRPEAVAHSHLPGRTAEFEHLSEEWSATLRGEGRMAILVGEAGIGKTALAGDVVRLAESTGGQVLQARCYVAERSLFLQPIVDAIRGFVVSTPAEVIREAAGTWAGTLSDLVPEIGPILRPIDYQRATADIERRRTFEAVAALLRSLSVRRPMLLFLDDLQNAGTSSLEFLHFFRRRLAGVRVLMLATLRSEEGEEVLGFLGDVDAPVELGPLPESAVAQLAGQHGLADRAGQIMAMTRGHALFVVEMLQALTEAGVDPADAPLPRSLIGVVLARVRRTGPETEALLRGAAVLGSAFDLDVAARLLGVPSEHAAGAVDRAVRAGLVAAVGRELEFANDLIREILYRDTPMAILVARHRRAADLLAGNPEAVGTHAAAAGDWPVALEAWLDAAERAAARFAMRDAERLLDRALHAATMAGDPAGQARARLARGHVREGLADYRGAYEDLWAAIERARAVGVRAIEMQALRKLGGDVLIGLARPTADCLPFLAASLAIAEETGDVAIQVDALARMAIIWSNRLRFDLAFEQARQAVALAREAGDHLALSSALDGLKAAAAYSGDLLELESVLPELQAMLRRQGELWRLQWTTFESSFLPMARGQWDSAARRIEDALEMNRRGGYRQNQPMFMAYLSGINRSRGEYGSALEIGRQAVELAEGLGHPWMTALAGVALGGLLLELRATNLAEPYLKVSLMAAERDGAESYLLRSLGQSALMALLSGDRDRATGLADRAETMIEGARTPTGRSTLHTADAHLAVATVRLELGDHRSAERIAIRPLDEAAAAGWKEGEASAAVLAARCRAEAGHPDEAKVLFRRALDVAEAVSLPAQMWQAHAGLASLAGRRSGEGADHLAEARRIVASLAAGIGDPDIRRGYELAVGHELDRRSDPTAGARRVTPNARGRSRSSNPPGSGEAGGTPDRSRTGP